MAKSPTLTLSVSAAARLVGGGRASAVAWLRAQGLVTDLGSLGERVVLATLERRLAELSSPTPPRPTRRAADRRPGDAL